MKFLRPIKNLITLYCCWYVSKRYKRKKNLWIFGEWFGERCGDNVTYLANYIATNCPEIEMVWVCKKNCNIAMLNNKIKVCTMDSAQAQSYIKSASVAVMGQGYGDFSTGGYNYFGNAVTINLWHGVMWKKIGNDGDKRHGQLFRMYCKMINKFLRADKYIAPSEEYGKIMMSAFGAKPTGIIKVGYPRNSIFYNKEEVDRARKFVLNRIQSIVDFKLEENLKIISYMPTFREQNQDSYDMNTIEEKAELEKVLLDNHAILIQKSHFVNQNQKCKKQKTRGKVVNLEDIDASSLLAATDLLITDYSGSFFDYLLLDRPIIHFLYDYEFYKHKDRGLYFSREEVSAGSVAYSIQEMLEYIDENLKNPHLMHERRKKVRQEFMTYESPNSSEIIFKALLKAQYNNLS